VTTGPSARLTDSHAHLDFPQLSDDLDAVLGRARSAGVDRILTVSSTLGDASRVAALAAQLPDTWAAVGVHPHEAAGLRDEHLRELRGLAASAPVVAIGEIGLDYHHDHSPREQQREAFRRQVRLAREVALPIVVHSREAEEDTAVILEEEGAAEVGGVIHCFTSSQALADRCLDLGLLISFSGIVTFRNADALREVARRIPSDRLLVETDSPYLAPVPHRGKSNEPAHVRVVAEAVAALRGETLEALGTATTANFERLFL